jgi:hypothetical protein
MPEQCQVLLLKPMELALPAPVLASLLGLLLQLMHALAQLGKQVLQTLQLQAHLAQTALCFTLPQLVLAHPGCLLQQAAPLLDSSAEQLLDHLQLDDRIAVRCQAAIEQQLLEIAQPARHPVEQILALPVPIQPAREHHLRKVYGEQPSDVLQPQRHLRHPQGLERPTAVEDELLHRLTAQHRRALLAQHPSDCIHDVALATAVGTHNRGQPLWENQPRRKGKRLEAQQLYLRYNNRHRASCHERWRKNSVILPTPADARQLRSCQ